jgi:hypothetical protein
MLFSENECRELAEFFAKRFSEPSIRSMLANQAGLKEITKTDTPTDAWEQLITTAQKRRKLPKLAIVASKTDQDDQNLQAVCNLLGARTRIIRNRVSAVAAAAVFALGFGMAGFSLGNDSDAPVVADLNDGTATLAEEVVLEPSSNEALASANTPEVEVEVEVEETVAPIEVAEANLPSTDEPGFVNAHTPPEERHNGPAWRNGRCTYEKDGDFIGYWYAGAEMPGRQGETIQVKMGVNVRKDYPGLHNDFDKRAKVRCIVKRGDSIKLAAAPILVPPDKYWVPLYHGDIVEEAPEESLVAVR